MKRLFLLLALAARLLQAAPNDGFNDNIDRTDPNFVKASVVIASPGEELFACLGHASIRLECPTFGLDYCFSYESESPKRRLRALLAGRLKMGVFAEPTDELVAECRKQGRSVRQYPLVLPPDVKQQLWKILDDRAALGPNLPYDYLARGCARGCFDFLSEAWKGSDVQVIPWQAPQNQTRRDRVSEVLENYPWTRFAMHALVGADVEWDETSTVTIILPVDLLDALRGVSIDGVPVLAEDSRELVPLGVQPARHWLTPFKVSILFVLLSLANFFVRRPYGDWALLALQSLAGVCLTQLVLFSTLPATGWNWLLVPFNLLPLCLWRWRRQWSLCYVLVLVAWDIGMLVYPHRLTDPAYLWLTLGYILLYCKFIPKKFIPLLKKGDLS